MAGGCHCNLNFNSSKDHTIPVAVWVIPKGAAVSDAAELDGLLGSAFFLHCRNRAVLAKPLAFCNLREEASISCLGYAGAHPCGFSRLIYAQVRLHLPFTCFLHLVCITCISCIRVLAVCAYHTPSFALFTTSNPISLFETVLTTTVFALSSLSTRASLLQTPPCCISGGRAFLFEYPRRDRSSRIPTLIVISPWPLSLCARHVHTA